MVRAWATGPWKNTEEVEENLCLRELELYLETINELTEEDRKFFAAIQGIDLEENKADTDFEQVKRRAEAKLAGKNEEEYELDFIGIDIETD